VGGYRIFFIDLEFRLLVIDKALSVREWRSVIMRKVLIPILGGLVLALACGGPVWADALHGQCNGSPCVDNGTNTPLGTSTTFGFTISPGPQTGNLVIDFLVPNNYANPGSITLDFANNLLAGTATLFSATAWTGGALDTYLGIGASPNNPIGAYLPTTQLLDPGATGFFVFQVSLGTQTILGNSGAGAAGGTFNIPGNFGSDFGGYILAFSGTGSGPYIATANSGALVVTPEPASLIMLFAGLLSFALLNVRRVFSV
jgi:hypothetical protein